MCGLVGYWSDNSGSIEQVIIEKMASRIKHRGPDDMGTWLSKNDKLALAHRRLSILDLSPAGHQPMHSPCGRYILIYNGEIYNHLNLRADLEKEGGHFKWQGHSDTETLLAALRHWGVEKTLQRLNGMFAFVLWDASDRTLVLARDRMGEKPLYYGRCGNTFLFASELKSLVMHPDWVGAIDRDALALYMKHNYVPAPWSIYQGIKKLPPAHFVIVNDGGRKVSKPHCYWDLLQIAEQGCNKLKTDEKEATDELDILLRDAVCGRMASDVPLGAFLSGGFDSTLVTALMQVHSASPVKTFTIGFHETDYNEATHAKKVARYLGTDHTELYVTPEEAMSVIPQLPTIWDEPFSDSSQIPTLLVSKLARQHVTVSLSGDGGDELFYGYHRYSRCQTIWHKLRHMPLPVRRVLATILECLPGEILERSQYVIPTYMRMAHLADRLPKLADLITETTGEAVYHRMVTHWKNPAALVHGSLEPKLLFEESKLLSRLPGLPQRMMFLDSMTYLPDDILTKVDRASMAVSLEARVPLLDHRVIEFAWRLPLSMKYQDGKGKWLFRKVLYRYIPRKLMERPKKGFGVPIDEWLRGPLREWADELLNERQLREEGFFNPDPIRKMWKEHVSNKRRWHYYLWDVLMFQAWLKKQQEISS